MHQNRAAAGRNIEVMERKEKPTIVIVGGGFGGLWTANALKRVDARVIVIDRENHHVFQPLLYQVATASLSPADVAQPIRGILKGKNVEVLLGEVIGIDSESREVILKDRRIPFDYLVLATGARHSYFGKDEWESYAPGLKTLDDATRMRSEILLAFERAEAAQTEEEKCRWLTFVIIGGGATGVELAGAIAEIARRTLRCDFDHIDSRRASIQLIEAGPRILPAFPEKLSVETQKSLEKLGATVRTNTKVEEVGDGFVRANSEVIETNTVLWAAGVKATPVANWLGVEADRAGRVLVSPDCSIPGHPNIFAIGDAMSLKGKNGIPLPGVAQVAMQQGAFVAGVIAARIKGSAAPTTFTYFDKGILATIGKRLAVAKIGPIEVGGFIAWFLWAVIHIWYLIGFRNKLVVMIQWIWSYLFSQRGARLITGRKD